MAMKESGVPWIGKIPIDWEIRPVKAQYTLTTGFTPSSKDDSLYDDEGETWVTISDLKTDIVTDSKQKIAKSVAQQHLKDIAKAGSLLYSFKLSVGTVAFAGKDLFTNEAIASFQPITKQADLHYLKYASSLIIGNANTNIYGAAIMNQKLILNAPLPVPSLAEQQSIAAYLDDRCSKLDEIITEAEKSIEEYKDLKQAVIFETVTKGLDKNVPMKDSGVEYIGLVPSHWQILPNKYLMHKEKHLCDRWIGQDVMSLTMKGVIVRDLVNPTGKMPESFDGYQYISTGDLLMCLFDIDVTPRCVGRVYHDGVTSPAYSNFKLHEAASLGYYYYFYLMLDNTKELLHFTKSLRNSITADQLGHLKVPYPSFEEQEMIAEYLDCKVGEMDALISEKQSLIEDLQAYKKSLIYEVVTGKRRVV